VTLSSSVLDAIVSEPVCAPAFAGEKATLAVQLAPAASDVPQVLPVNLKPVLADSARLSSETVVLMFEMVTGTALLVEPAPVIGKLTWAGCICKAPLNPPIPLSATVVDVETEVDAIVNVPASDPDCTGENTTPTAQLAPPARLVPQLF
jgi:hypothetical protein